ncbi:MAG: hypothetical protein A2889_04235 [Nitrospinae bacterium RIFCSPLOWO2_01_FULL_39_10]|nr:MAG: hypothetical protein A2889_04235 [Nitrospinae bacterium RIFCSPLOWO2_01_FULL_39_10]
MDFESTPSQYQNPLILFFNIRRKGEEREMEKIQTGTYKINRACPELVSGININPEYPVHPC